MTSQLQEWLLQLQNDGLGGPKAEMPAIPRGKDHTVTLELAGDFSAAAFVMNVRLAPDAPGDPLATFNCSPGAFANGVTPVTLQLLAADQTNIPADADSTFVLDLVYEIDCTPAGGVRYTLAAGIQPVRGAVNL